MERKEHGFILKDINIFKKTKKEKIYYTKLETDLPEMNSIKDFATWCVSKIPMEQKLDMIKNIKNLKEYTNTNMWDEFHILKSKNPKNPQLIYEREPEKSIDKLIYDLDDNATILDLGCGDGVDSIYFQSKGFDVHSLDISPIAIEENKNKNSNVDWKVYDISQSNIPYSDKTFDLIYCRLSLHYFDRFTVSQIIHNIMTKLKDGGVLYFTVKTQSFKEKRDTGKKFLHKKEWMKILNYYFDDILVHNHTGKLYNIPSTWLEFECYL